MLSDPAVYFLAYDALIHPGGASPSRFETKYCNAFANKTTLHMYAKNLEGFLVAALRLFGPIDSPGARSLIEPPLMVRK